MTPALSSAEQEALRHFSAALAGTLPQDVLEVRLFGSRARGDAKPWSDMDLLIVARDDAAAERIRQVEAELHGSNWSGDLPLLVPFVLTETEFRRHQAMRSLLYRDLRDQGIPLWQNGVELWNEEGIPVIGRERDVRFHLEQAERVLRGAKLLLDADDAGGAVSRAYYAAFHAASAALLTENIERAKHGDLIGEFDRMTRQNRLLGRALHNKLRPLYKLRQDADYGNTFVKDRDARMAVAEAERFVAAALSHCREWLARQQKPEPEPEPPRQRRRVDKETDR